jgi:hypothetical protein
MQVCPELEMAVSSLARFMPADYQREAAKRIIEVYEQWLQSVKKAETERSGTELSSASFRPHSVALSMPITDTEFTEVKRD